MRLYNIYACIIVNAGHLQSLTTVYVFRLKYRIDDEVQYIRTFGRPVEVYYMESTDNLTLTIVNNQCQALPATDANFLPGIFYS